MRLGVRTKLFLLSLGLIAGSLFAAEAYLTGALDRLLTERAWVDLRTRLGLVAHAVAAAPTIEGPAGDALADSLGRLAAARVTLIGPDGVVRGDSALLPAAVARLENHGNRPEVEAALRTGTGEATRYSATAQMRTAYAAAAVRRGAELLAVARLALPLSAVDEAVQGLRRLLFLGALVALIVAVLLSGLATHFAARSLRALTAAARRMVAGDLGARARLAGRDEVAEIGRALDELVQNLAQSLATLKQESDLQDGILNGMREGLLLLDAQGAVRRANPALRELFRLGPDVVGRSWLELNRHPELKGLFDRVTRAGAHASAEIEVGDLPPRHLLVHAVPHGPPPLGLLVLFVDVTELRRLESMRRDFVANVSHELRTPLATARGAIETLRTALAHDPAAVPGFLDMLERTVDRLHRLTQDLLDLSRLDAAEVRLTPEPLTLAAVVAQVQAALADRAGARGITLHAELPADLPAVMADRRGLEQVLTNLLDNALCHCPPGTAVRVHAALTADAVRVAVADTGPGVEPRHLPRLFERFYRADAGRSRAAGGTGLGLAIVKGLVTRMGGTVGVESPPGAGATFFFTLPRARA